MLINNKETKDSLLTIDKSSKMIQKMLIDYDKNRAVTNVYDLEKKLENIEQSYSKLIKTVELIEKNMPNVVLDLKTDIRNLKNEFQSEFGKELDRMLKEKGINLRGQYPTLYIGIYKLEIDFSKGSAKIFFGPELLKSGVILNPSKIISTIDSLEIELKDRKIDYTDFSKKLYEAFVRASKLYMSESSTGEQKVTITAVFNELTLALQSPAFRRNPTKENFRGYNRWLFGYDLYKLKELKRNVINNKEWGLIIATMEAAKKEEHYLWVPANMAGEGNRYSYIFFREVVK